MTRFPTYPPDILSRADELLSAKYGTDKPIDPEIVELVCRAMMEERERIATIVEALAERMEKSDRNRTYSGLVSEVLGIIAEAIRGTE